MTDRHNDGHAHRPTDPWMPPAVRAGLPAQWLDAEAKEGARARQQRLTKPPGSLGVIEDIPVQLAALQGTPLPAASPAMAMLFASDHRIAAQGVSPYPSEVTAKMMQNFVRGGAAASVLAKGLGMPLRVVDVGVNVDPNAGPGGKGAYAPDDAGAETPVLSRDPVADAEEGDFLQAETLSKDTMWAAFSAGQRAVQRMAKDTKVLVLGEMGIGNTTHAAALTSALLGIEVDQSVGKGTGCSPAQLAHKTDIVRRAHAAWQRQPERSPWHALAALGGKEIAAIAGAAWQAASQRTAVLVDGYVVSAGLLPLCCTQPEIAEAWLLGHRSAEPGHRAFLASLNAEPLLDLRLALGEGSGALLAYPLVSLACALHANMATFADASIPTRSDADERVDGRAAESDGAHPNREGGTC